MLLPIDGLVGQIKVEIEGLRSVAAAMRSDLENGYRSQVPQVHDAMQTGATIGGHIAGEEWPRLQNTYSACIQATLDALFNLDKGTQAVAQAAELIARNYGDADAFAQARAQDVQALLAPVRPSPGPAAGNGTDG